MVRPSIPRGLARFLRHEVRIELRRPTALAGLVLYVLSSVFVLYFMLTYNDAGPLTPVIWASFFWLIMVYTAVSSATRSMFDAGDGLRLYYHQLLTPVVYILGKLVFNVLLTGVLMAVSLVVYTVVLGTPGIPVVRFVPAVVLGAAGFSLLFTLVSGIAARAEGNAVLSVVLGFPLSVPLMIYATRISRGFLTPETAVNLGRDIGILCAFDAVIAALAIVLFPYIWRD